MNIAIYFSQKSPVKAVWTAPFSKGVRGKFGDKNND